ncbi:hypothetical protein MesoLj131b_76890 (plasmid) [Mesorhizobium sp. 131-2-5]|uniref:hypothetical protein n=1 Tax=Mesorhizobium sp. 131-2-5 TaxID=2744519 RepID=UPI0018EB38E6|nr:hypothetical protein [Mesorhizobium sp. 131-2-5]BCH05690.1 hypothetical protein MesoLj131b_76890 [Mesorhizobium sp. 131-2-5]
MTRDKARAALLRQIDGLPDKQAAIAHKLVPIFDEIEDDASYLNDVNTLMAALQFVEYMATGVRPRSDALQ